MTRHSRGRALLGAVAVLAFSALLASCSQSGTASAPSVSPDTSAKAVFDADTGTVTMPLDAYDPSEQTKDAAVTGTAGQLAIAQCMKAKGLEYPVDDRSVSFVPTEARPYGVWDVKLAAREGYNLTNDKASKADKRIEKLSQDQAWSGAVGECQSSTASERAKFGPSDEELNSSLVTRLKNEAFDLASAQPQWSQGIEAWRSCLKQKGLTPRTGAGEWSSKEGLDLISQMPPDGEPSPRKEEEIRVATLEAQCNESTHLSVTLGDLQAGYEAALIAQNQAALNDVKSKNQSFVEAAKAYVAANG